MYQLWGNQMLKYTVEKHTLYVGKVCRLCEEFAVYVCYRGSLYHFTANPYKTQQLFQVPIRFLFFQRQQVNVFSAYICSKFIRLLIEFWTNTYFCFSKSNSLETKFIPFKLPYITLLIIIVTLQSLYSQKLCFFFQRHKLENLKQMLICGICFRI